MVREAAIHEGNGHVVLFVDEKASQAQVDAFATILSGKMGGMPWEALAGTITKFEGPVRKPIDIQVAAERSLVQVPGAVELRLTPLKNPVTGKDKQVHIVYPTGGFFWNDAKITTTGAMHAEHGDLRFEWPKRYAAAAEVNWPINRRSPCRRSHRQVHRRSSASFAAIVWSWARASRRSRSWRGRTS